MINLEELLNRRLLMVSGKGGTGKSLTTALLGMWAAARGKRVLLVESAVCEQLPPLFGHPAVGHQETAIAPGIACINLIPRLCFKEYVAEHLGLAQLYKRVFDHRVVKSFLDAIPGLGETMLLGRLFHTCVLKEPSPYDLVVFDAPAMGHFFNLLTTPDAIIDSGLVGPLVKEVSRVRAFLADSKRSAGLLVAIPEDLVISETLEFLPRLKAEAPLAIAGLVINRYADEAEADGGLRAKLASDCPRLGAAVDYVTQKISLRLAAQRRLMEGLDTYGLAECYGTIPDCGPIAEPLSSAVVEELLRSFAAKVR